MYGVLAASASASASGYGYAYGVRARGFQLLPLQGLKLTLMLLGMGNIL